MDNLENKEKTAEDVLIADEDLDAVAGGEGELFHKPCPLCGKMTVIKTKYYVTCHNKGCMFQMRIPG